MEIRYTQGRSADDGQPCEMSVPDFDAFERQIRDNVTRIGVLSTDDKDALNVKKRRLPYVWHAFKPGTARRRCAVSAGDLYFLPLDLDGVTPAGWICIKGALGAYRGFAYTTASHLHPTANGEHRARIVLASTRPITALEKQRVLEQLQARIMDIVDIVYDGAVRWDSRVYNSAQMLFLPDERAEFTHFSGKAVEVDALLAAAPVSTLVKPEQGELDALEHLVALDAIDGHTFEDLRSAMWHPTLLPLAESYPSWVDMGNRLAWFKETDYEDQALALWLDWSAAADNSDVDAAASKWNQLTADRTGYQAIFAMAQKNGWQNPGAERLRTTVASDSDFDDVTDPDTKLSKSWPAFVRKDKTGEIRNTIDNVTKAIMRPDFCGWQIRFDQFRDEIMIAQDGDDQWVAITDPDYSRLRITLERRKFEPVSKELMRDVVLLAADETPFDSAMTWLNQLTWDGVPRVKIFFHKYFGVDHSAYTTAVSVYAWTALAGRVLTPGCKADMVPVLVGEQGCGKSTGIAAISPATEFFTEISLAEKDEDLSRKMRGRLVGEISELRGLNSKEIESIKAFITRTHEVWVPKYREFATQFPRRLVMFGTTNQEEFLADDTGNRRWLPLRVGQVKVDDIKRDVLQLWAEAREMFIALGGVQFREAEQLANGMHEQHMIKDAWLEIVERWLDVPDTYTNELPRSCEFLRAADVLRDAIGLDPKNIGKREEMRISNVLQNCGFSRVQRRVEGKKCKVWVQVEPPGTT